MMDMDAIRNMARDFSPLDRYGVACEDGLTTYADSFPTYESAKRATVGAHLWAIALNHIVIDESETKPNQPTDAELEARAKALLTELRAVQREIVQRYNARQTPAKAVCGHDARDKAGLYCDCPTCPNFTPF